jgi:putative lipoic acid-binding regulatory protein
VDLLESTHTFPGPYTFKVIGRAERGFAARVVAIVRDALAFAQDPPFSTREATGGRHVAVTLTPQVASAEQVLHVYGCLRGIAGLVMVW